MSTTIISVFVILAAQILPHVGVVISDEQLTGFITTGVTIAAGLWVWYRRYRSGDVKLFGGRK